MDIVDLATERGVTLYQPSHISWYFVKRIVYLAKRPHELNEVLEKKCELTFVMLHAIL